MAGDPGSPRLTGVSEMLLSHVAGDRWKWPGTIVRGFGVVADLGELGLVDIVLDGDPADGAGLSSPFRDNVSAATNAAIRATTAVPSTGIAMRLRCHHGRLAAIPPWCQLAPGAEPKCVSPRVGMASAEPLWSHIRPCTDGGAGARQPQFASGPCYSEIDQVCEVIITDQNVRWFDVPVYQSRTMRGVKR
jgi:hypothetical protein